MKTKSEEWQLIEAAQMRMFYASLGVSDDVTEAAIKIRYQKFSKPSPAKGRPKRRRTAPGKFSSPSW